MYSRVYRSKSPKDKRNEYSRAYRVKNPYYAYKVGALHRGVAFTLMKEEVEEMVKRACRYCGTLPEEGKRNGIDRVDNDKGYEEENCVPCCWRCNDMKSYLSVAEFVSHCELVVNHNKREE